MEAAGVKAQQTEAAVGRKKWDQLAGELESVPVRLRGQKNHFRDNKENTENDQTHNESRNIVSNEDIFLSSGIN